MIMSSSSWLPPSDRYNDDPVLKTLLKQLADEEYEEPEDVLQDKSRYAKFLLHNHLSSIRQYIFPSYCVDRHCTEEIKPSDPEVKRSRIECEADNSFQSCESDTSEKEMFKDLLERIELEDDLAPIFNDFRKCSSISLSNRSVLESNKLSHLCSQSLLLSPEEDSPLLRMLFECLITPSILSLSLPFPRSLLNLFVELLSTFTEHFARYVLASLLLLKEDNLTDFITTCFSRQANGSIKSFLFPIYFSIPRIPNEKNLPLMEILADNKEVLNSKGNQDIILDSILSSQESEFIKKNTKFGKFLLGLVKRLPCALCLTVFVKCQDLANRHSSFFQKSINNELKKKSPF